MGKDPSAIVPGDFNGDGALDLATANRRSDDIAVIFNDGAGRFGDPDRFSVGVDPQAITAADFNADGRLDLASASRRSGHITVLLNRGPGDFEATASYATGRDPLSTASGDVDGDGGADIVTANQASGDISLFLNLGAGTFAEAVNLAVGQRPVGVHIRDLNGDALLDVLTANQSSEDLSLLFNSGGGTFRDPVEVPVGFRPAGLSPVDLDGDGSLDVAVSSQTGDSVAVFLNDRTGGLTKQMRDLAFVGGRITLAAEDFDSNGTADIAVAHFSDFEVSIFWNGEARAVDLRRRSYPSRVQPHGATAGDMDGDGDLDLVTVNGGQGTTSVFLNDGKGVFTEWVTYPAGGWVLNVTTGDFDRDGHLDFVFLNQGTGGGTVFLNNADGTFSRAEPGFPTPDRPRSLATKDLDGDGHLDVVTSSSQTVTILRGKGDGTFTGGQDLLVRDDAGSLTLGDVDGDGDEDLAVVSGSSSVLIWLNDGDLTFGLRGTYAVFRNPVSITAADYDGDGDLDLATANASKEITLFLNQGNGILDAGTNFPLQRIPHTVVTADVDNDDFPDLITCNSRDSVSVMRNTGNGRFTAPIHYAVGAEPRAVMTGNVNLDGQTDILTADRTGFQITVLLSQGTPPLAGDSLATVCTELDFAKVSIASRREGAVERTTKYTLPADADDPALLGAVFQNVSRFPLHQEFLATVFPEHFPDLTPEAYDQVSGRRATRRYFVGALQRLRTPQGPGYGFNVFVNPDPREVLALEEVRQVLDTLSLSFQLRPLGYAPDTPEAREAAEKWSEPGFPIYFLDTTTAGGTGYEPYSLSVGYGGVRRLRAAEFLQANDSGRLSSRDIVVLERAPRDIEGVVAGVITAEPQGELSHLAVRTARRGTPNAYVEDAMEKFAPFEGKLVRLEVLQSGVLISEASLEEAQAFWNANRPELSEMPGIDPDFAELSALENIALAGNIALESRFGGKASNLSRLQQILDGAFQQYRERGFAIPMHYYLEFMQTNSMPSEFDGRLLSYTDYLQELFTLERFQSDSRYRFALLEAFRQRARREGQVDLDLVDRLHARIEEIFSANTKVRLRSSSNVEDVLEFNGAGLYESTGACVADLLDNDPLGPSHCDPSQSGEQGVIRALKKVWSSLWTFRAYEERDFYGIEQQDAAMGILVNRSFLRERANGVAFTGNPSNPLDRRYTVVVQVGEESVVSPSPGVLAEKDLLEVVDGDLVRIDRPERGSSLLPPGEWVLSEEELGELGALLWHIEENFPLELGDYQPSQVLLDIEFKIETTGELAVKQVRPFLNATEAVPTPTFELEVPPQTLACGVFVVFRPPQQEYELKSQLRFLEGTHLLPTATTGRFSGELFEELRVGPERELARAVDAGLFKLTRLPPRDNVTTYRFEFEQEFELDSGSFAGGRFTLRLSSLEFEASGETPLETRRVVDEDFLASELVLGGGPLGDDAQFVVYSSCHYDDLPGWQVDVALEGGDTITLGERFRPPTEITLTGPAALVRAEVSLGGQRRVVTDYWSLVYAAARHNVAVRYWAVLDPPLVLEGLAEPVFAVEVVAPDTFLSPPIVEAVYYLDEDFQVIATPPILAYDKRPQESATPFRRGDSNDDGRRELSDVVFLLDALFRAGPAPSCRKAADANDDGRLNVSDAAVMLLYLFRNGVPLPQPFEDCGLDPTPDSLGCKAFSPCS